MQDNRKLNETGQATVNNILYVDKEKGHYTCISVINSKRD